jgi:WD40 repeat protein
MRSHRRATFVRLSVVAALTLCAQASPNAQRRTSEVSVELRATLAGHEEAVDRVMFSPDGELMATGSEDETVRLWETRTGELKAILRGEEKLKWEGQKWGLNRQYIAAHKFPDVDVGPLKDEVAGGARELAVSPDGRMILTLKRKDPRNRLENYAMLKLWDAATGQLKMYLERVPQGVSEVFWSPDGKTIIVDGSGQTRARLMDVVTGRVKAKLVYQTCTSDSWSFGYDYCSGYIFNADGSVFLKQEYPLKLWSTNAGEFLGELKRARMPVVFSPADKRLLLTLSKDKRTALLWEVVTK